MDSSSTQVILDSVKNVFAPGSGASTGEGLAVGLTAVGAGLAMIGVFGTGVGQGLSAGKAAEAVGRNPEAGAQIRNMMIIGMAIAESSALYAFVISILLVFVF